MYVNQVADGSLDICSKTISATQLDDIVNSMADLETKPAMGTADEAASQVSSLAGVKRLPRGDCSRPPA
jgi:hypothetical protein